MGCLFRKSETEPYERLGLFRKDVVCPDPGRRGFLNRKNLRDYESGEGYLSFA